MEPTILWPALRYRDAPPASLTEDDYGSQGFTVRDPESIYWSFGTYAGV